MFPSKLYNYVFEAPVAYDDDSDKMIGKIDPKTKTKWGELPPIDMSIEDLRDWVYIQQEEGVLGELVGEGATRQAIYNDGKTVFKFNYSQRIGNQTKVEAEIYKKYGKEFSDILPKVYRNGENWIVQEKAEDIDADKFRTMVGLGDSVVVWMLLMNYFEDMEYLLGNAFSLEEYKGFANKDRGYVLDIMNSKNYGGFSNQYTDNYHILTKSPIIQRMVEFCEKSGTKLRDMKLKNWGLIKNRIVIIDSGFNQNMKN